MYRDVVDLASDGNDSEFSVIAVCGCYKYEVSVQLHVRDSKHSLLLNIIQNRYVRYASKKIIIC